MFYMAIIPLPLYTIYMFYTATIPHPPLRHDLHVLHGYPSTNSPSEQPIPPIPKILLEDIGIGKKHIRIRPNILERKRMARDNRRLIIRRRRNDLQTGRIPPVHQHRPPHVPRTRHQQNLLVRFEFRV